MLKFNMFFS